MIILVYVVDLRTDLKSRAEAIVELRQRIAEGQAPELVANYEHDDMPHVPKLTEMRAASAAYIKPCDRASH